MQASVKQLLVQTILRIRKYYGLLLRSFYARLDGPRQIHASLLENDAALLQSSVHTIEFLQQMQRQFVALEAQLLKSKVSVRTGQYGALNPEIGLLAHLYAHLPNRVAVDVGANIGDVSKRLLDAGYEVYAVEPYPPVFAKLRERLSAHADFHSLQLALGDQDAEMDLHVAADLSDAGKYDDPTLFNSLLDHPMLDDLVFEETVQVSVRSLASLAASAEIPDAFGLMKIDAEGYDLKIIQGMSERQRPAVVVTEFWDANFLFGKQGAMNRLADLVAEMRRRAYHWHIVIYRGSADEDISFYCNQAQSLDNSWGNVFFFRDQAIFKAALDWCSAVLPPTYFND
jgi:FkbM family methyltransferase